MELNEAQELIAGARLNRDQPQLWADLGCGEALFSRALAHLLPAESRIICCDKEKPHFVRMTEAGVSLEFEQLDFEKALLQEKLDGVLMANALHYASDPQETLSRWQAILKPGGYFLCIEYDTKHANRWVPFPLSVKNLEQLLHKLGAREIQKLGERKSLYGAKMYALMCKFASKPD
ncbi:class I SAM-dependent methyltransferase [Marinilongibacter aquaticus]|uniref:class I SAM-dependent methyltransferase n=1 Tax=Marinilongibacter aquaticus TaxID=2975157 RepID=UPI0021BDA004|nr:class I SAM-dependent methyltransferase [Marinilongibacter aquaticus]UBM59097.1 class I SAM-dependent methyltransferase [Marinilongibacter aquaticus]